VTDESKQQSSKSAAKKENPKPELKLEDVRAVLAENLSALVIPQKYANCSRNTVPQGSRLLIR
jgi:predicted mannosyl-3-phosphoglycerate phosphatase (HAD superfamily)